MLLEGIIRLTTGQSAGGRGVLSYWRKEVVKFAKGKKKCNIRKDCWILQSENPGNIKRQLSRLGQNIKQGQTSNRTFKK